MVKGERGRREVACQYRPKYMAASLTEFEDVRAVTALPRSGGGGAYSMSRYVKAIAAKQDNWGRHAKRSR